MNTQATRLLNRLLTFSLVGEKALFVERRKHRDAWRPGPVGFRGSHESQFANMRRHGVHKS